MGNEIGKPELADSNEASVKSILNNRQSLNVDQYVTEQQLYNLFREKVKPSIDTLEQELTKLSTKVNVITEDIESLKKARSTAESSVKKSTRNAKLPKFSGNPEEWHHFRASYETSTAADDYSNEENLIRLQDSLKGPALESVRGLLMHPNLVPKVIETLENIYGNPELLFVWHLKKLRALENPTPENVSTCAEFANAVEQLCDLVEASDMEQHQKDVSLVNEFLLKMPASQISEWNRMDLSHDSITLRRFCDFVLNKYGQVLEAYPNEYRAVLEARLPEPEPKVEKSKNTRPARQSKTTKNAESSSSKPVKETLKQEKETTTATEKPKTKCQMCNRMGHPLWYCRDFIQLNVETRVALVTVWNVCKICLCNHINEGREKCAHRIRCNVNNCRKEHNSLLHPSKREESGSDSDNSLF